MTVAVAVLVGVAAATATAPSTGLTPQSGVMCSAASPPCGYISPILDLAFPAKPKCGGSSSAVDPSGCITMPAPNGTVRFAGTVTLSWVESEDLTYAPDANAPIVISFSGVPSNPAWLGFKVDPPTYTISAIDLFDARNSKVDSTGPSPTVYYWYERPINVTFTRSGSPDADGAATLAAGEGLLEIYVRAKSTPSGATFNAGFGGEYFRFNASSLAAAASSPVSHSSPAGILAPAFALLGVTLARRRRPW